MFIFTVTEEVASSVVKTFGIIIGVGLLLSPFVLIANITGLDLAVVIAVGLFVIFALFVFLLVWGHFSLKASEKARAGLMVRGQCDFIRANGTKCEKGKTQGSELCAYHDAKSKAVEILDQPKKSPRSAKVSTRKNMKHCGLVLEDGTKCKKLRYVETVYCSYHTKLNHNETPST